MSKALDGVKILDFTHVQSGPTCTQLLAWFGADVIKVERRAKATSRAASCATSPMSTASTSRCSTTTSARSRSTPRTRRARKSLETLIKQCDVLVENFAPGALDRMGFTWERIQRAQPAHDRRLGQGLRPGPVRGLQGLRERRAVRRRRRLDHRLRRRPAARHRRADRRQRHRPAPGARHRRRALPAQHAPAAARRCSPRCRTAC